MRLLELKVKNIASLKGEHTVSFRELMRGSPLFAITGETGSGKSSILNSIGLALYGRIFKSSVQQNDVVTLGEKEGQIELLFQVREKTYLAQWRARVRKQNGELYSTPQSPLRDLYEVDGSEFSSPKTISNKKVEDILHLDFDQFCKCVILNQGEFARFLSSSFTERKDILEKLYPGEVLEGLSGRLRVDLEDCRKSKESLEIEMSTLKGAGQSGEELKERKEELTVILNKADEGLRFLLGLDGQFKTFHHYFEEYLKNQKKADLTKQDIQDLTRVQNEFLVVVSAAHEAYDEAMRTQEKERPRLLELLKIEEKEERLREREKVLSAKVVELNHHLKEAEEKFSAAIIKESELLERKKSLAEKIDLPVEELKIHEKNFISFFDHHHELKLLSETHLLARKRLEEMEEAGKEKSLELHEIQDKKKLLSPTLIEDLSKATQEKSKLIQERENLQRSQVLAQEIDKALKQLSLEHETLLKEKSRIAAQLSSHEQEILPLRTTQKLSSLLSAVTICRTHESTIRTETCPVCEGHVPAERWKELNETLSGEDLKTQMDRLEVLERELIQLSGELKTLEKSILAFTENIKRKSSERDELSGALKVELPSAASMDEKIARLEKQTYELKSLTESEKKLTEVLSKTRDEFARARQDLQQKSSLLTRKETEMGELKTLLSHLLPQELTAEKLATLKVTMALFKDYMETEHSSDRAIQDKNHLEAALRGLQTQHSECSGELKEIKSERIQLSELLLNELGAEKASHKIHSISQKVKTLHDEFKLQESQLKKHELVFKEASGRLILLNEHLKDLELQFIRARDEMKALASSRPAQEREGLKVLENSLRNLDLDLQSPAELFIPLKELLLSEKEHFEVVVSDLKEQVAATVARLADWESRQDKITLLELRNKELLSQLGRLERLYDVLGKDELRTFVLSLVEENLIEQTNDELQKLCQGRYEIVHQSRKMKLTPEFYVLDKFREGGLRKVATLSGGETFMVSLAMAIALAEMTRGQAEIDSLFIDEGFGTLDQDSLEDVLDMLNQIQTRGLMVGVISHIKALTNSLPVNLLLSKRQDGTSSLSLQYN